MNVKVIKEGKEDGQGVAYLDDGTMIVVDDGINFMNQKVSVSSNQYIADCSRKNDLC